MEVQVADTRPTTGVAPRRLDTPDAFPDLYGAAGLGQLGPPEQDTRGIARGIGVNERWVGAAVLAPGVLDVYRYYRGSSRWARWGSRAAKMALLLPLLTKDR